MNAQKKILREKCQSLRLEFTRRHRADIIVPQVLDFLANIKGTWGGFMPLKSEPDLSKVYSQVNKNSGVTWAFPCVNGEELNFRVPSREGQFVKSSLGILEPGLGSSKNVDGSDLTGILIPGVAFDINGFRLGRGRGFYDRFLKSFSGTKVGVCFSVQLLSQIPHDNHDQKMDVIITEEKTLQVSA